MLHRGHPLARRRRGAMLLWFLVIALPLLFLAGAIAVDMSRVVMMGRQAAHVADATALAGAQQFQSAPCGPPAPDDCRRYSTELDTTAASQKMQYMVDEAQGTVVRFPVTLLPQAADGTRTGVTPNSYGTQRVTAVVQYEPTGLLFLPVLQQVFGFADTFTGPIQVIRSADVCTTGEAAGKSPYGPTDGYCTRPDPRQVAGG